MKRTITHFVITAILLMFSVTTRAYDVEVDGIYYNLDKTANTASVTYNTTSSPGSYSGSVSIPETFVSDGTTYSVTSIGEDAFYYCSGLTSVTIPNSVTSIESYAFEGCSGLTSVTIPNSVTSIGSRAFYNCYGLTSVTIPNSVTSIGNGAFSCCDGLTSISVESGNQTYDSRDNCNALIETSSNTLIAGCKNTVIPNSVTSIGSSAFYGCSGLTSVTIPNSVTSIGSSAFCYCTGLTSVTIPNSVTSIGFGAFSYCKGLTSVTIGNSVTSIGDEAFSYCKGLTSVIIGNSVKSIGSDAFYKCTGLTSVIIPNSVTSIESLAFNSCTGLTSVTIPNSVTSIGWDAFYGCSGLTSVYNYATTPQILSSSDDFSNAANCTLYVPEASIDAYKAADYWKDFKEIIGIEPSTLALTDAEPTLTEGTYDVGNATYTRTVTTDKYATFCLPFDVDMSTMSAQIEKAYTIAPWCVNTTLTGMLKLMVNEVESDAVISAGTPFLAKMTASPVVFTNCNEVTFDATTANPEPTLLTVYDNDGGSVLKENKKLIVKMGGTYSKMTELDTDKYRAFTTSGSFGPCSWLNCFRAYVYKDDSNSSARIQNIVLDFGDDTATGIDNIESPSENSVKTYYNLNGQRVSSTTAPGLYIVNGKKIIKK